MQKGSEYRTLGYQNYLDNALYWSGYEFMAMIWIMDFWSGIQVITQIPDKLGEYLDHLIKMTGEQYLNTVGIWIGSNVGIWIPD